MNKRLLPWIRKHLKKIAGYGAGGATALVLAGCATTPTTSSTSLAACKSLTNVTVALTQVKPLMSPTVQKQTTTALETAASYCTTPNPPANANQAVAAILDSLNTLTQVLAESKTAAGAAK